MPGSTSFDRLCEEARACQLCASVLPHAPRPVFRAGAAARLLIVGQAPGRRVHESGIPWNDPSGDTLRRWLGVTSEVFYDTTRIAILPTGFCYPGSGTRGDLPPRPECAPAWHPRFRAALTQIRLTLLIGQYAQAWYLGAQRQRSLTETVRAWRSTLPAYLPTPHPSPRNRMWLTRNPWFETEVIPALRAAVHNILR
ncbi:MAG: uracil-DNA glycosylase family protein [Proteobacteria bacterium]|nr:uracil-DNA glycosylase family protein [Pseudomonadota bacterium]